MFRNATTRTLIRAERRTVAVQVADENGTVTTARPARKPGRRNVEQAAIRASQLGLNY